MRSGIGELQTLVYFGPEAVLQCLLRLLELLLVLEPIQARQDPHHLGESMYLPRQSCHSLARSAMQRTWNVMTDKATDRI